MAGLRVGDGTWASHMLSMYSVLYGLRHTRPPYCCPADSGYELTAFYSGQKGELLASLRWPCEDTEGLPNPLSILFLGWADVASDSVWRSLQKSIKEKKKTTAKTGNNYLIWNLISREFSILLYQSDFWMNGVLYLNLCHTPISHKTFSSGNGLCTQKGSRECSLSSVESPSDADLIAILISWKEEINSALNKCPKQYCTKIQEGNWASSTLFF